jgi:hypothetical protein
MKKKNAPTKPATLDNPKARAELRCSALLGDIVCKPMFLIECVGEEASHTEWEAKHRKRTPDEILYLRVRTKKDTWMCRAPRGKLNDVFNAIQQLGVTVEF